MFIERLYKEKVILIPNDVEKSFILTEIKELSF